MPASNKQTTLWVADTLSWLLHFTRKFNLAIQSRFPDFRIITSFPLLILSYNGISKSRSSVTVTGSLRTLTWFPIILATTIVLRHWKTLSKPSITKNQKMSSSCPKIHLADGKKVVRGILWSTLSPSAKTQNRSRPWRDWQPFASAFSKDEIRHLHRLSRGSADPREHSRSWWLVHRFVNNCILHVGYGFECAVQKT